MFNLVLFELRKILNHKKAFLFLLVMNIVPVVASLALLIAFISCRGLGLGNIQFVAMKNIVQGLFTGHFTLFGYIAPFFLALIVGDSFSTEFGRGYMKMLLITPVKRWQVITAKSIAIIAFLLVAVVIGGVVLQADLLIAKGITQQTPDFLNEALNMTDMGVEESLAMVSFLSATELLVLTFVANLMMIGFLIVFSMFFESAILMSFCSLGAIMAIHVFYVAADLMRDLVKWFGTASRFCFTRHFTDLFSINLIRKILNEDVNLFSASVLEPLGYALLWAAIFYALAVAIFSRKQVLH